MHRPQAGQSAVEFALILPVIVLILMGVFDLGRAFYAYSVVADAAREGARAGVYATATDGQVAAAVTKYWIGLETAPVVTIWPPAPPPRVSGNTISVTVRYVFRPVTPVIESFLPGRQINIVASSVMVVE
jgi:hypothetical protein